MFYLEHMSEAAQSKTYPRNVIRRMLAKRYPAIPVTEEMIDAVLAELTKG